MNMTRKTITQKVTNILCDKLGVNESDCCPSASLSDDMGADSLDFIELIIDIEEEFSITIQDGDLEEVKTVGDLLAVIYSRLNV